MKNEHYVVWFENSQFENVICGSFKDAAIIATARRIENGQSTKIKAIGCKEYPELNCGDCRLDLILLD